MSQWSELSYDERVDQTVIASMPRECPHCHHRFGSWIVTGDASISFNIQIEEEKDESSIGDSLSLNVCDDSDAWQVQCGECGENIDVSAPNSDLESVALRREFV